MPLKNCKWHHSTLKQIKPVINSLNFTQERQSDVLKAISHKTQKPVCENRYICSQDHLDDLYDFYALGCILFE